MPGFGDRVLPDQVTSTMRARLARKVYSREFVALAAVFVPCLLIAGAVIAFYHFHIEPAGTFWELMGPIVVAGAVIALTIHAWGMRERKFVETAQLAAATVKQIESSPGVTYKYRLILSYRPIQYKASKALLPGLGSAHLASATVESNLPGFSRELQPGDSVTILYDPAEPDHVYIVEEERTAEEMRPTAA